MFGAAPASENYRRVPVAFGCCESGNADGDGRGGAASGAGGRLSQSRDGGISGGFDGQLLLPRGEYAAAGGASGDGVGDWAGPCSFAIADRFGRSNSVHA